MRRIIIFAALLPAVFLLVLSGGLYAAGPIPDRPLTVAGTDTVGMAALQLKISGDFQRYGDGDQRERLEFDLVFGLSDNIDLGLALPFVFVSPDSGNGEAGMGDIQISLKSRFLEESSSVPSMAVAVSLTSATGDEDSGTGTGKSELGIDLLATKHLARTAKTSPLLPSILHFNLGFHHATNGESESILIFGVASEWPLANKWTIAAELKDRLSTEANSRISFLVGARHRLTENTVFDFAIYFDLGSNSDDDDIDFGLTAGTTISF